MKNRFSRMGKSLLGAMCLLSTCALTYSCSDDYDLDETMPSFLKGSIYDELKASQFNYTVQLIDDLEYKDVLSKTGSKTLFVAPDSAFEKFFATTTWTDAKGNPVRSYSQLTQAQKAMLFYGSMLNNADVLEMLTYSSDGGDLTMRRSTAASAVDTVPFWKPEDLPVNLNVPTEDSEGNATGDKRFWDQYNHEGAKGILMALDASSSPMIHFLEEQMKAKDITHEDISFVLNLEKKGEKPWLNGAAGGKRAYVYDAQIVKQDVTCMNGYFNILDKVLVTPPNMAECIRQNPKTQLFSRLLDRFSAPYYSASLTADYRALHDIGNDSVFEKKYISSRSSNGAMTQGPDKKSLGAFPFLTYDPGWNAYAISSSTPMERDMGAFFVPTDEALAKYFWEGGGRGLMNRYALPDVPNEPGNWDNLITNLYQIPLDIIQALINNLLKDSFIESVPSKYLTIMNDAQDQMFPADNYPSQDAYKAGIDTCLLANNGVVYVMNSVITPADYAAVIGPVLYSANTQVMKSVARADDNFIEGTSYNNAPLKKYYSTYLKAMQSRFSFFVPTDDALGLYGYVDPMSIAKGVLQASQYKYWRFTYKNTSNAVIPVRAQAYRYDISVGPQAGDKTSTTGGNAANVSEPNGALTTGSGLVKRTLLIDMMDQHIVVHDTEDADNNEGINSKRTYFLSRGGAPVYVAHKVAPETSGVGMIVDGGYQLQLKNDEYPDNDHDCEVTEGYNMTAEQNGGYGNGMTYLINRPMQPTTKTVYAIMRENQDNFSEFYQLCQANFSADQLIAAGFQTEEMKTDNDLWKAEVKKYRIFNDEGIYPPFNEKVVRFFNNYRYTVYIPTNEKVQEARQRGLMTYDEIIEYMENHMIQDEEGQSTGVLPEAEQVKVKAMITLLMNFLKYHFQDESLFVDNVASNEAYQTSCIDNINNVYLNLNVKQTNGAITLYDAVAQNADGSVDESKVAAHVIAPYNLMARDADFDKSPANNATSIKNSSFVTVHQIDNYLLFDKKYSTERFDKAWSTPAEAASFVKKYRIK